MRLNTLCIENFRNISRIQMECGGGTNIVYGSNAHGKTNLLEAVWMLGGERSFRGAKDAELISFGCERARISAGFDSQGRTQTAEVEIDSRRSALLNGVKCISPSELGGAFKAVVFAPSHLALVQDGPQARRRFLDTALAQLLPRYGGMLREYGRAVKQRNTLLRDVRWHTELLGMLDAFEEKAARLGARITCLRGRYTARLGVCAGEIYSGLSGGSERTDIRYAPDVPFDDIADESGVYASLRRRLAEVRQEDIESGVTSAGPHRDDIQIDIDGRPARSFGSQGQQRSAALAMKLAEASLINTAFGEQPVALLDDVMSELDESRQDYILNHIKGWQVFITCCDPSQVLRMTEGQCFEISGGAIVQRQ